MKRTVILFLLLMNFVGAVAAYGQVAYTPASMFIWTDKYVYQPGEQITLRWTARANGDPTPYTAVIYLQNNQTGVKTYFSLGAPPSTVVTDIFGRTPDQGFSPVVL